MLLIHLGNFYSQQKRRDDIEDVYVFRCRISCLSLALINFKFRRHVFSFSKTWRVIGGVKKYTVRFCEQFDEFFATKHVKFQGSVGRCACISEYVNNSKENAREEWFGKKTCLLRTCLSYSFAWFNFPPVKTSMFLENALTRRIFSFFERIFRLKLVAIRFGVELQEKCGWNSVTLVKRKMKGDSEAFFVVNVRKNFEENLQGVKMIWNIQNESERDVNSECKNCNKKSASFEAKLAILKIEGVLLHEFEFTKIKIQDV